METMEFSQQCGIEYVVPGHPGSLLRPVSLPVNEVFQLATPSPRIQNVLDLVDSGGGGVSGSVGPGADGENGLRRET